MTLSKQPNNGHRGNDANRPSLDDREERIAAYVEGEMSPDEASDFENLLRSDAGLRREVEEWRSAVRAAREWMDEDVPGVGRVAALEIPSVAREAAPSSQPATVVPVQPPLIRRALAVAAIFAAGFVIGHWSQSPLGHDFGRRSKPPGETANSPGENGKKPTPVPPKPTPDRPDSIRPELAGLSSAHYETDDRGRLIVETNLKRSGAPIRWVVDSGFRPATSHTGM